MPRSALCAFRIRRLHGLAGQRERLRRREPLALLVGLRRLGLRLGLLREDLFLGCSVEEAQELILVDRLALDEDRREPVQLVHVLLEHLAGAGMRLFDHPADLGVDLARDLLRVVGLGGHLATEERQILVATEHARAELLAHPVAHDHLLRGMRDLLQVVRGSGGDLVEDELLGRAPAEDSGQLVHQGALRRQVPVLARQRDRVAERLAAADDRDLVDLGVLVGVVADHGVAHLVVRGDLALRLGEQPGLLLGPGDHAHDPFLELLLADRLPTAAR